MFIRKDSMADNEVHTADMPTNTSGKVKNDVNGLTDIVDFKLDVESIKSNNNSSVPQIENLIPHTYIRK